MPEATVLYSVTAAVIVGLVAWVMVVLKTAKEPWARAPAAEALRIEDVSLEAEASADAKADASADASADTKAGEGEGEGDEVKADVEAEKATDEVKPDAKVDEAK